MVGTASCPPSSADRVSNRDVRSLPPTGSRTDLELSKRVTPRMGDNRTPEKACDTLSRGDKMGVE
jgi:hypothetical protein